MSIRYKNGIKKILTAIMVYWVAGCTGLNTFPHMARGGDSVLLAIGSADGMTKDNITVEYASDADPGNRINLLPNVIGLFKLYPNKKSMVFLSETTVVQRLGHEPWLTTMAINLPNSIQDNGPLPIGPGKVYINCVPKSSCTFPSALSSDIHINGFGIALEIIPGQGQPNPFKYRVNPTFFGDSRDVYPLSMEEIAQVTARPNVAASATSARYGGMEARIRVPITTETGGAVGDSNIYVFAENLSGLNNSQVNLSWMRTGDVITVFMTSPVGMVYQEARFSIVLRPPTNLFGSLSGLIYKFSAPPILDGPVKFYDTDGNLIAPAISPTVNVVLENTNWLN